LVPLILNSGELWGKHAFLKFPGTITVGRCPRFRRASRARLSCKAEEALEQKV